MVLNELYTKRVFDVGMFENGRWAEMIEWCRTNLYHGGHYEPNWYAQYPNFYFKDKDEYLMFCLRYP